METEKILEFRNYSLVYRGRNSGKVYALNNISFSISRGETIGIAGESGSGKSTLCRSILRIFRPWETDSPTGSVFFKGENVLDMRPDELQKIRGGEIAMLFQHPYMSFNPVMKIGRQIKDVMELHGCEKDIQEILLSCGLETRVIDMYPHNMSGGMLQRAQLALALATGAEIIIADEPTTSLDACSQFEVIKLLRGLVFEKKLTLIFVSHNLRLIKYLTSRTLVFYGGFLVEEGPSDEVFKNPLHPYTRYLLDCVPGRGASPVSADETPRGLRSAPLRGSGKFSVSIPGLPPEMTKKIAGCPFFERCPQKTDVCRGEVPFKRQFHKVKCFYA